MLELLAVIIILALVAIVLFAPEPPSKARTARIVCFNNLKQVGQAFWFWSIDYNGRFPMQVAASSADALEVINAGHIAPTFITMSNQLNTPKVLLCPADLKRKAGTDFSKGFDETNISYFVGLDAAQTAPNMFLTGDDNIELNGNLAGRGRSDITTNSVVSWSDERHRKQGNVGLADGSVQGFSITALRTAIKNTGTNINRLAFP